MNIIFDLDGTLIDSSAGILRAAELAFESTGIELKRDLTEELVGPPLRQLLEILSGTTDENTITLLSEAFKRCYDNEGYKETTVFKGIDELLSALKKNAQLYIATNKRMVPTRRIIDFLEWNDFFSGVYALDTCEVADNKAQLIKHVLQQHQLDHDKSIYVGDTVPDRIAAQTNDIDFVMVSWGYEFKVEPGDDHVASTAELVGYLERFCIGSVE